MYWHEVQCKHQSEGGKLVNRKSDEEELSYSTISITDRCGLAVVLADESVDQRMIFNEQPETLKRKKITKIKSGVKYIYVCKYSRGRAGVVALAPWRRQDVAHVAFSINGRKLFGKTNQPFLTWRFYLFVLLHPFFFFFLSKIRRKITRQAKKLPHFSTQSSVS